MASSGPAPRIPWQDAQNGLVGAPAGGARRSAARPTSLMIMEAQGDLEHLLEQGSGGVSAPSSQKGESGFTKRLYGVSFCGA